MVESSQASSSTLEEEVRALVDDALSRLGVDRDEVPAEVVERLSQRGRLPDHRLVVGRYLILGELGRGGMGVVYEAWDPGIERRVAVKTIEPDLVPEEERDEVVERFRRETKIVGRLHHPSIVTIFDSGNERVFDEAAGKRVTVLYYYVMEYLDGRSLARVLRERQLLPEMDAVKIAADIAEALHLSHEAGIIHRDIKPSNIFLRDNMQAVLLDFGIAKTGSVALTRQGQILGTPSYLAPERLREKEAPIDGRADIFSLGVLLYTMLTGEAPFVGDDVYEVIDKIAKESHPKIDRRTPHGAILSQMLDTMLAKDPKDRYQSAAHAADALKDLLMQMHGGRATSILKEIPELDTADVVSLDEPTPLEGEENTGKLEAPPDPSGGRKLPASEQTTSPKAPISASMPKAEAPPPQPPPPAPEPAVRDALSRSASVPNVAMPPGMPPLPTATDYRVRPTSEGEHPDQAPATATSPSPEGAVGFDESDVEQTAEELPAQTADEETDGGKDPVRVADVLGTRPELALMRETRELGREEEPPMEKTSPSIPPYATTVADPQPYEDHDKASDETTDDETIADPDYQARAVRAFADERATEQLVRAKNTEATERGDVGQNQRRVSRVPSRHRRSRIEASLVDEEDVVVKPAPLEALKPDELPTQTGYQLKTPPQAAQLVPAATSAPDVVRARGDSRVPDPAEIARDEGTQGGSLIPAIKDEDQNKSAAVARKTFGPRRRGTSKAAPNIQVRMSGRALGGAAPPDDRMRMIRRRGVMLLAGALASVAIGLMLGRMQRSGSDSELEAQAGTPTPEVKPRAAVRTNPATGQLDLVRPRPPSELIADAEAAQTQQLYDDAQRLFTKAVEATRNDQELRPRALLGLADVLRARGDSRGAIKNYRLLVRQHSKTEEATQAMVTLKKMGVAPTPPRPKPKPETPPAKKTVKASPPPPPPPPAVLKPDDELTPTETCRVISRRYMKSPADALRAFERMRAEYPREPCVYWNLGRKYKQLGRNQRALDSYQRYLELNPRASQRETVEKTIADLKAKLRQR